MSAARLRRVELVLIRLATAHPDLMPADAHGWITEMVRQVDAEPVVDEDRPATVEEAARTEQVMLWADLEGAMRDAAGGCWSIGCEQVAYRIQSLALLVGATPWEEVSVRLLRGGVYERVLREVGIEPPEIDWVRVAEVEARIASAAARIG